MNRSRPVGLSFFVLAALAGTACSGSASEAPSAPAADPAAVADGGSDGGEPPKASEVTGTPANDDLTEKLGVFVTPSGSDANEGTRAKPLATIQVGIDLGKRIGKRVYVCSGTFREALTLADSVAVVGGLFCNDPSAWRTGSAPTRLEAPSSPAVRAKDLTSSTRLEGFDIVAPDAAAPSGSSIGLLAVHAPGLAVAKSSITSGKGASGAAGAEGLQLVPAASLDGDPGRQAAPCGSLGLACPKSLGGGYANAMGPARPGICLGEAGHDGEPGGRGGAAGVFRFVMSVPGGLAASVAEPYMNLLPTNGEFKTGATGGKGVDGASASTVGTLGLDGYVPEDGRAGTAGAPGSGGAGGNGTATTLPINQPVGEMWHGASGAGGGAGGCPGLAGKPGTGGGASIAIALFESPIVLDGVKLTAGTGGQGGAGTFGSSPTMGGAPGVPAAGAPNVAARGGNGGAAGISTNGSNGPSFGIYHSGAAPTVKDSVITPGAGGAAIDARSATDSVGNVRTIPAAPAGLSKDIFTL